MCCGIILPPYELRNPMLTLQHRPEGPVSLDRFPWAAFLGCLAVAESKSNKERLGHVFFPIRHGLKGLLFLVDLLVLGHVSFVAEVIEVAGIRFRVQLGYERRLGLSQRLPVHFTKVLMFTYVLDVGEALGSGVDTTGKRLVYRSNAMRIRSSYVVMKFHVLLLRK